MSLLIESGHAAREMLVGVMVAAAVAEVVATYVGQARNGRRRIGPSVAEAVLLRRRPDGVQTKDHGTKRAGIC